MWDTRTQIKKILQYNVLRLTGTAEHGINAVMNRFYSYVPVKRQIFYHTLIKKFEVPKQYLRYS